MAPYNRMLVVAALCFFSASGAACTSGIEDGSGGSTTVGDLSASDGGDASTVDGDASTDENDASSAADAGESLPDGAVVRTLRAFVTDETYSGNLAFAASSLGIDAFIAGESGSLTHNADALCNLAASNAGVVGSFKAYVGTPAQQASARFHAEGPWRLLTGELAFTDRAQMATGPSHAVNVTETGRRLAPEAGNAVWTFTSDTAYGMPFFFSCGFGTDFGTLNYPNNVTGTIGDASAALSAGWQASGSKIQCLSQARLYCFQDL